MRMAARIDGVASRVQSAMMMKDVSDKLVYIESIENVFIVTAIHVFVHSQSVLIVPFL